MIKNNSNLIKIATNSSDALGEEENLFSLISEYIKKLLKNTTFPEIINKNESISKTKKERDIKIHQIDLLRTILIQNSKEEQIESYFNTTEFVWENIAALGEAPTPRRGHSMVLADTYLIVFGGSDLNSKFYNDVYYFDLIKKLWMKVNCVGSIPTPRADHSAVIYGSTMWVFGGASNTGYLNDLYSFNIETVKQSNIKTYYSLSLNE